MKLFLKTLLAFGTITFSTSLHASIKPGVFLSLGIGYDSNGWEQTTENPDNTAKQSTSTLVTNFSGGYSLGNGFIVGIKYYGETYAYEDENSGNTSDLTNTRSTTGVMGGYAMDGLLLQLSYLAISPPNDKATSSGGTETEYTNGSGFIVDIAYMFDVGGFMVGPQLSHVQFDYEKRTINSTEDTNFVKRSETWIKPQFAVSAIF